MVQGRKAHARYKVPPGPDSGRHGVQLSDWRVDPRYGQHVYQELGPLEEWEMQMLAARKEHHARRYCRTIYGSVGGEYAWRQYLKWRLAQRRRRAA